jgi:hypothetical protein
MVPDRADGTGFAATAYGIAASPCPAASALSVIHDASAAADHVQSRAVEMDTVPDPPPAVKDDGVLLTLIAHLLELGAVTEVEDDVQAKPTIAIAPAHASVYGRLRPCIRSTGGT